MNMHTLQTGAAAALVGVLALAGPPALAQEADDLVAVCTDSNGALFRIDNESDREFDFMLQEAGGDGEMVSGSAYPIGRGGAFAYLPAGSSAELVVRDEVMATAEADGSSCAAVSVDEGRPMCEMLRIDTEARQALFVGASEFRGVSQIDITVENGKALVYDPHALFVIDAGGSPDAVFEVESDGRMTETFDAGILFNAGYGILLKGNDNGQPVALFATITSPGGVVECDPQFVTAGEDDGEGTGALALDQNAPNPFREGTQIEFTLDEPGDVTLRVYDVLGRHVVTLAEGLIQGRPPRGLVGRAERGRAERRERHLPLPARGRWADAHAPDDAAPVARPPRLGERQGGRPRLSRPAPSLLHAPQATPSGRAEVAGRQPLPVRVRGLGRRAEEGPEQPPQGDVPEVAARPAQPVRREEREAGPVAGAPAGVGVRPAEPLADAFRQPDGPAVGPGLGEDALGKVGPDLGGGDEEGEAERSSGARAPRPVSDGVPVLDAPRRLGHVGGEAEPVPTGPSGRSR